nr:transporter substrate-binding domain-containing protein [uncultured Desulfobacter sp.]
MNCSNNSHGLTWFIETILCATLLFIALSGDVSARDLVAGVGFIPPHAFVGEDGRPKGGFVEVVRAMDDVYTKGTISIKVLPVKRSIASLKNGNIDFQIPYIPNPQVPGESLSYTFASETVVDVCFVLYAQDKMKVPPMDDLEKFNIATLRGAEAHFPFRISGVDSFRQGIKSVSLGRLDGFIAEQEASDRFIRLNKIKNIRRTLYAKWQSSIAIRKGPGNEEIDRIVSSALLKLRQTGQLQKITMTIHRPYEDWQPYLTAWPSSK